MSNLQDSSLQTSQGNPVLLPVYNDLIIDTVPEVPGDDAAKKVSNATERSPSSLCLLSNKTIFPFSEPLYDYICAFVSENPDSVFQSILAPNSPYQPHEDLRATEEHIHQCKHILVQALARYKISDQSFRRIMRCTKDRYDLNLLQLVLRAIASDENWSRFSEGLLVDASDFGNTPLLSLPLGPGVDNRAHGQNRANSHTLNALQNALHNQNHDIVTLLRSHGAKIFTGRTYDDLFFLSHPTTQVVMEFVRPLLAEAATSTDWTAREGVAVLSLAVKKSYDKVIDVLLEAGFSPFDPTCEQTDLWEFDSSEYLNKCYNSPFLSCLGSNTMVSLRKFLRHPFDSTNDKKRMSRQRQLHAGYVIALFSENIELKNTFLETGLDPGEIEGVMFDNYVRHQLYHALNQAASINDCKNVERLINIGAAPNPPNTLYRGIEPPCLSAKTPLQWAVGRQNVNIVRRLIDAGADVNSPAEISERYTVLQRAVMTKDLNIVDLLVTAGANVNAPPSVYGKTAIEIAAELGDLKMVPYLLKAKADIQGRHNQNYRRAVYRAGREGHGFVIVLLHEWKRARYGEQDCDTADSIMGSMTQEELNFPSEEARIAHSKAMESGKLIDECSEDEVSVCITHRLHMLSTTK